jgi:GTPase
MMVNVRIVGPGDFKFVTYGETRIEPIVINRSVNVGTIGHVDMGKSTLSKAIDTALKARANKSDRKRDRANRWR